MDNHNRMLDSGDEAFSPNSHSTIASQNAYNRPPPPIPGQTNLSHNFLTTIHGSPFVPVRSDMQFNEPSGSNNNAKPSYLPSHSNFNVRPDRQPLGFNFNARPDGPPPFSNVNPKPYAPLPSDFNAVYNHPPRFSNFNANHNVPPPQATFHSMFNRPPPLVDTNCTANRPHFQTNSYGRLETFSTSEPVTNASNRHPFPGNVNVRLVRPPPLHVRFNGTTCLPPPNDNCNLSEFKTNVSSNENYSSNIGNATGSNFLPSQQLPLSSDQLIPLPSRHTIPPFLPPTLNLSFPAVTSCQPTLPISSLHSQRTSGCEHGNQLFLSSDCSEINFITSSTLQHERSFSHFGLHGSRDFTKDQSCSLTPPKAVPSCTAPPPNRHMNAGGHFSAQTQTEVASAPVVPFHPLYPQVISFKKDQDSVNKWLEGRKLERKCESPAVSASCSKDCADRQDGHITINADSRKANISKLADVHGLVAKYTELLKKLRQCYHTKDEKKRASVKVELDDISSKLLDPCYQSAVQRLVAARRKKRSRAKHSRKVRLERWQAISRDMDRQRELLSGQYKAEERQKRLVAEADAVLHEVRGKKEECVSLQLLLAALRDLRQHRLNRGDQQGFVATQHHTEHFEKVTEGLDEMLESQLQDYELEERTLRAMLDQQRGSEQLGKVLDALRDDTSDHETQITSRRDGLFGCAASADPALLASYTAANTSREMLLSRRRAWDKFLVEVGGSGIPVFWVTPPEKPSGGWEKWRVQP